MEQQAWTQELDVRRPARWLQGPRDIARFLLDPVAELIQRAHQRDASGVSLISRSARGDWVCALGPANNREVLTRPAVFSMTPNPYPFEIRPGSALQRLNQAVVYVDGEAHKRQRACIAPAMHPTFLSDQMALVADEIVALSETWRPGSVVDLSCAMRGLSLRISQRSLFGRPKETGEGALCELLEAYVQSLSSPGVFSLPFDLPLSPVRTLYQRAERVERTVRALLAERRMSAPGSDLMSVLLHAGSSPSGPVASDEDVVGNLVVLFLASHETVCQALIWGAFLLAQHPHITADLRDELDAALGPRPPTHADLPKLPLLERVAKEVLRICSPIVYMMRVARQGAELSGRALRPGTRVVWSPFMTQRLPELYSHPNRFDPSRWERVTPVPYAYLPFGAGPHACIGGAFATGELMIVLAVLVQRLGLEAIEGAEIDRKVHLTLSTRRPIQLRIKHRADRQRAASVRGNVREIIDLP